MIPLKNIREDLKDIRCYHARKEIFDSSKGGVGLNKVLDKVERYNQAIVSAPPRLYDLYVCLYTMGFTQEALSVELGLTPEYVQMQHKKLLLFLQAKFEEREETDESEDDEE